MSENRENTAGQESTPVKKKKNRWISWFGALCGLYKRFPGERGRIAAAIDGRIDREDFNLTVTGKMTRVVRIDYTEKVRTIWKQCKESV